MGFFKKMLNNFEEKAKTVIDNASAVIETKIDAADAKVQQQVYETSREGTMNSMKSNANAALNTLGDIQLAAPIQMEQPEEQVITAPTISEEDLDDLL